MTSQQVHDKILSLLSSDNLNLATSRVLDAMRNQDRTFLEMLFRGIHPSLSHAHIKTSRIFSRLVLYFHPDKATSLRDKVKAMAESDDLGGLQGILSAFQACLEDSQTLKRRKIEEAFRDFKFDDLPGDDMRYSSDDFDDEVENPDEEDGALDGDEQAWNGEDPIDFPTALLRKEYGHRPGVFLTPSHLGDIERHLEVSDSQIELLDGIEHCVALESIDLSYNLIVDLGPLSTLNRLVELNLSHNRIHDLSALSNLSLLASLNLAGNPVRDLSCLEGLANLKFLDITDCPVDAVTVKSLELDGVFILS